MGSYLITGGAGFIGSHLAERLLRDGHRVLVLDDLSTGSLENLETACLSDRFQFVNGSVSNDHVVREMVDAVDTVFHLAATVGVLKIMEKPAETIANNIRGAEIVLEAARRGKKKVVVTSTSEVYGKTASVPFREDGDMVLGSSYFVRWGYAASKVLDEFLARAYFQEHGVPTIGVRPFNTIGPRQVGTYGMVVPRLMEQALRGEELTVYGDGGQTRCFTYVADTVEWLYRLTQKDAAVGEVFNLGNPHEISIRGLAERIVRITGSRSRIRFIPYAEAYQPGFEDMGRRVPCNEKVLGMTGHAPSCDLDAALHHIHQWLAPRHKNVQAARAIAQEVSL